MNVEIKAYKAPQGLVLLRYEAANLNEALRRAESEGYRFKTCLINQMIDVDGDAQGNVTTLQYDTRGRNPLMPMMLKEGMRTSRLGMIF